MEQAYRVVYSPFVLKLLHIRLLYLDKLLVTYLPQISGKRHDVMRHFIIDSYHIGVLLDDIAKESQLLTQEEHTIDLYFVNFEYALYRMSKRARAANDEEDGSLAFTCEQQVWASAKLHKKEELLALHCRRYLEAVYFDSRGKRRERLATRVQHFFNLKHTAEKDASLRGGEVIYYDKSSVMTLLYLYFLDEFMAEARSLSHRQYMSQVSGQGMTAYIQGLTDVLSHSATETVKNDPDILFLAMIRSKLCAILVDHMRSWCIKEEPTTGNEDMIYVADDEELSLARHSRRFNHYTEIRAPEYLAEGVDPYRLESDEMLSLERLLSPTDRPKPGQIRYLPFDKNRGYYEAIASELLFHIRLTERHTCQESCLGCNLCDYLYKNPEMSNLITLCTHSRYNALHRTEKKLERVALDEELVFHNRLSLCPALRGHLFRLLYTLTLLLYHTDFILPDRNTCTLFEMVNLHALLLGMSEGHVLGEGLAERLVQIVSRVIEGREERDYHALMHEQPVVASLALEMHLLTCVCTLIDKQRTVVEKYERSLTTLPANVTYTAHATLMAALKRVYLYYMRTLYSQIQWNSPSRPLGIEARQRHGDEKEQRDPDRDTESGSRSGVVGGVVPVEGEYP